MVVHNRRNNSLSVNIRIIEIKKGLFHPIHRISILRSLQFLTEEIRGKSSRTSAIVNHMFLLLHFSFFHFLSGHSRILFVSIFHVFFSFSLAFYQGTCRYRFSSFFFSIWLI